MEKLPSFEPTEAKADEQRFHHLMKTSFCSTAELVIPERPFVMAHLSLPEADLAIGIHTDRVKSTNKPIFGAKPFIQHTGRSHKARKLRKRHIRPGKKLKIINTLKTYL